MRNHRIIQLFVVLVVAGCGGGGGGGGDAGGGGSGSSRTGPEEFGLTDEELNGRIDVAEAAIARCMADAGFEYVPVDAVTVREAMNADGSLPGVSDEDFVAQYGFGITTIEVDPVEEQGRGEQNTRIREALGEAERAAYDRALLGDEGKVSLARALEDEDLSETGGCTRVAVEPLFDPEELLGTYVNPVDVRFEQDPRLATAIDAWSACVGEAGYDYAHPDDITDELLERLDAVGSDAAALAELQGEERAVAVVATACEEEHIAPVEEIIETEIYGAPQG